jgi:RNA polymerase subunit RPABC4/transcription elongation factor Spt4
MDKKIDNTVPLMNVSAKTEEEKINAAHSKIREILRITGPMMLIIGGLCIAIALFDVIRVIVTDSFDPPKLAALFFIGGPLLVAGFGVTSFAFMGAVVRYQAAEAAPVAKDTFNYMADGTQEGIKTVVKAVGEGLASGFAAGGINAAASETETGVRCHKCNFIETSDAKFCSNCGAAMEKSKPCPQCHEINDPDAKFCDNCGRTF